MKKLLIILVWFSALGMVAQQQTISTTGTVTIGPEFTKINANFTELYDTVGIVNDSLAAIRTDVSTHGTDIAAAESDIVTAQTDILVLENEQAAKNYLDATASTTLDLAAARIFSKTITSARQWTLTNETAGDEFTIYCAAGSGSLNAALFTISGKTVTTFVKIDTYDNTKPSVITGKILYTDGSNATISYYVVQPLD